MDNYAEKLLEDTLKAIGGFCDKHKRVIYSALFSEARCPNCFAEKLTEALIYRIK